jgi:hypothetical protein
MRDLYLECLNLTPSGWSIADFLCRQEPENEEEEDEDEDEEEDDDQAGGGYSE